MMQLATSPRPHPPPVPPRPSRQVVAEALKRSPRPPCPTRQAPPPPNTKPWRSEDHETGQELSGRTIVYESLRESSNSGETRSSSEPRAVNELLPRVDKILPRRRSNDEIIGRVKSPSYVGKGSSRAGDKNARDSAAGTNNCAGTSERYGSENHRERQQGNNEQKSQLPGSNGRERLCDWENSTERSSENDDEIGGSRIDERSPEETSIVAEEQPKRLLANNAPIACAINAPIGDESFEDNDRKDDAIQKNFEGATEKQLDAFATDESIAKTMRSERSTDNLEGYGKKSGSSGFAKNSNGPRLETIVSTTPTRITNKRDGTRDKDVDTRNKTTSDQAISRPEGDDSVGTNYGSTTTISSDDRATVVVVDEPERKMTLSEDNDNNIHHQDWLEAGVRYSSTKITLPGDETIDRYDELSHLDDNRNHVNADDENEHRAYTDLDFASIRERIAMSSLQGLPPLPRSLSGFNLNEGRREAGEPPPPPARSSSKTSKNVKSNQPSSSRPSPPGRQLTTLDTQLAILRKEMFGLRQLDLSLLSQLWSLNESIQEFRQLLQEQEDRAPSPSPSSEEGDDTSYGSHPPPPPRRPAPLLHHHRPPRPPRPLRPPASDESPSSEEYGAV